MIIEKWMADKQCDPHRLDADPDPDHTSHSKADADPDPIFNLMRIRILTLTFPRFRPSQCSKMTL
jgi:hypothetical protein